MSEPGVHCGQVGQPSPDAVRRTEPPVATIAVSVISESQAKTLARRVISRGNNHPEKPELWVVTVRTPRCNPVHLTRAGGSALAILAQPCRIESNKGEVVGGSSRARVLGKDAGAFVQSRHDGVRVVQCPCAKGMS